MDKIVNETVSAQTNKADANTPLLNPVFGEIDEAVRIPAFLKPFNGITAAELLKKYFPPDLIQPLAGALSGLTEEEIMPVPVWVKNASWQFWKNFLGSKPLNPDQSIEDFGVLVKLIESGVQRLSMEPVQIKFSNLNKLINKIAGKLVVFFMGKIVPALSDEDKAKFYAGRVRGAKIVEMFQNPEFLRMAKRAFVYFIISLAWKKIEELPSHAERERWLRAEKVMGDNFTSREVYDVFDVIGLPAAAPGRPKKLNPESAKIGNQDSA